MLYILFTAYTSNGITDQFTSGITLNWNKLVSTDTCLTTYFPEQPG